MKRAFISPPVAALAASTVLGGMSLSAVAQSGSRSTPPAGSGSRTPPSAGSGTQQTQQAPLALQGYCAVSILEMHKWVKGNPAYGVVFDGHTYLFANEQAKQMFLRNPVRYAPALGGDDVVASVTMNKRVAGDIRQAATHNGRLFLFANAENKQAFLDRPEAYADADLAYGGKCVVCLVGMQQDIPGKPELTVVYKGLRYLFASTAQRDEFLAHPERYAVAPGAAQASHPGSGTRPSSSGSGSRPTTGSGSGSR